VEIDNVGVEEGCVGVFSSFRPE